MKVTKVRSFFAVALLVLPTVTLNAGVLPSGGARPGLSAPQPVALWCWMNIGGRWYYLPC